LVSTLAVATAHADSVSIYQGSCAGASHACSALNSTSTGYNAATFNTLVASGSVPSTYNYSATDNSIGGFLGAPATSLTYTAGYSASSPITTSGTGTQTEWVFTGTLAGASTISLTHDDGVAFFLNGVLLTPVVAADPTAAETSTFTTLAGGNYTIDYVSSNGLPEVLTMSVTPVPLPPAISLFGTGLAALGFLGWRKKRAAAAI
jgi:hypothetical protein